LPALGIAAEARLQVNEAATRVWLERQSLAISLAVENHAVAPLPVRCEIDLLDPENRVVAHGVTSANVGPATSTIPVTLDLPGPGVKLNRTAWARQILWYRLRYRLTASLPATAEPPATGILSIGRLLQNSFNLEVGVWRTDASRRGFQALVQATRPFTGAPVEGVNVEASIAFDKGTAVAQPATAGDTTDASGHATLRFDVPDTDLDRAAEMHVDVIGRLGGYEDEAEQEFESPPPSVLITTDKPLYQPGQVMHARALVLAASGRALAATPVSLIVRGPTYRMEFRSELTTSRFGVAHADWTIPDHQPLGTYSVEVQVGQGGYSRNTGYASIRISRYELPQFTVSVKPDHSYYLPGQDARVEVHGDYLFGKPVSHGHVKVVGQEDRTWNAKERKWDVKEAAKYEGEANDQGVFTTQIDLKEAHRKLADEGYERYQDLHYTAYVTDPSAGRTEERRFDLRVTKQPIHVYLLGQRFGLSWMLPVVLYMSASYADGNPAECDIELHGRFVSSEDEKGAGHGGLIATVRTNHYGVAKVSGIKLAHGGEQSGLFRLTLDAHDAQGRAGQQREDLWGSTEGEALRVETGKTLYRDGEPIEAQIVATVPRATVQVNVGTKRGVVESQRVELIDGQAVVRFPYRSAFAGAVSVDAFVLPSPRGRTFEPWQNRSRRTVLFPKPHGLEVRVHLDRDTHRPGEEAWADFAVAGPSRQPVESDLGVMVFDKAVEERARTDQDFSGQYGFFYRSYAENSSVGGVTREDLDRVDFSKPLPEGLDLVAEVLLASGSEAGSPLFFNNGPETPNLHKLFAKTIDPALKPLQDALDRRYDRTQEYPKDEATLRRFLSEAGVSFDALRDPWGNPYHAVFSVREAWDTLDLQSPGPDKKLGTGDGLQALELHWTYFRREGEILKRAFADYHRRTGGYIRDLETLRQEATKQGPDIDSLRDKWGQPYHFEFGVDKTTYTFAVESGGPDKRFERPDQYPKDDFAVWKILTDYSAEMRAKIDDALAKYVDATGLFPQDEAAFVNALSRAGLDWQGLRDPWGHPYYVSFRSEARYSDRITIRKKAAAKGPREQFAPVTLKIENIILRSAGPDGKQGTEDDFVVAQFDRTVSEQLGSQLKLVPLRPPMLAKGTGAIGGTVKDGSGAFIPDAIVHATLKSASKTVTTKTRHNGTYSLRDLAPGEYEVSFVAPGFMTNAVSGVPVLADQETDLEVTLAVRAATQVVTVYAEGKVLETTSASMASWIVAGAPPPPTPSGFGGGAAGGIAGRVIAQTPRLREYFPETLVWEPELITDANGHTQLKFKLADNITTWKMSVIGSTVDGEVGTAEKEFRAFQPFFLQLDPPPVLTQGDEIALPVVARNYLDQAQPLDLEMAPSDWFSLLSPARQHAEIAAGGSVKQVFAFRATRTVVDGKQRVTAIGSDVSDAIERKVSVHPDGQEITQTLNRMLGRSATLVMNVPPGVIPGSAEARLEIYPNLMAHVIAGIEGMLERPYGCGEQIISSAYPSLLLLRYYKLAGHADPALEAKARRYLELGYERLLSYQASGGGFTYWGQGDADVALTAYALRFFEDASEFLSVDPEIKQNARGWLLKQQQKDGRWLGRRWYRDSQEDSKQTALLTAYVARVLAALPADKPIVPPKSSPKLPNPKARAGQTPGPAGEPVAAALGYLRPKVEEVDEPYLIAAYTLAALAAHRVEAAAEGLKRLRALVHHEAGGAYWALETNTPFYGWGQAGRIETTALAVEALVRGREAASRQGADRDLVEQGLIFLLGEKDRYGVWCSTQATVNVLQALTLVASGAAKALKQGTIDVSAAQAEVTVNGHAVGTLAMPASDQLSGPVGLDISRFLAPGENRVEIHQSGAPAMASVELVATRYEPWREGSVSAPDQGKRPAAPGESSGLKMSVQFSTTTAKTGDEITCHASAERVGFRGYGMLLAEIGLPPGAEVDRQSLEHAEQNLQSGIGRYDVLPDRVVLYLWPQAGGAAFDFSFRPQLGEKAKSATSVLYDYYNPEARAVVSPTVFTIQ
jgi:hypothetical protein